ncbi:MAG: hypothetical protein NT133_25835, partial [Alphaproteobacteria bacterium]|nr:hypothetical protein [Alphaproteobacteria bacterium]
GNFMYWAPMRGRCAPPGGDAVPPHLQCGTTPARLHRRRENKMSQMTGLIFRKRQIKRVKRLFHYNTTAEHQMLARG